MFLEQENTVPTTTTAIISLTILDLKMAPSRNAMLRPARLMGSELVKKL